MKYCLDIKSDNIAEFSSISLVSVSMDTIVIFAVFKVAEVDGSTVLIHFSITPC